MKFVAVRKPRAARLACYSDPFMASTKALERLSVMPRTTASARSQIVLANFLNGSSRQRLAPARPGVQVGPGELRIVAGRSACIDLAQRHLQPPRPRAFGLTHLTAEEGGVSHFRYGRDNALLSRMHARLMVELVLRLPLLLKRKLRGQPPFQA